VPRPVLERFPSLLEKPAGQRPAAMHRPAFRLPAQLRPAAAADRRQRHGADIAAGLAARVTAGLTAYFATARITAGLAASCCRPERCDPSVRRGRFVSADAAGER